MNEMKSPFRELIKNIHIERKEVSAIYFYAIFAGVIQLSLPLGVQTIISYALGTSMVTSIIVLIFFVVLGVLLTGLLQISQMKIIEKIQQKIFVRYSFAFAEKIPAINLERLDALYLPELTNRFFDTVTLQKGFSKLLLEIPAATIQIIFGLLLLSLYHPMFVFFGITLLLILCLILYFTGARGLKTSLQESTYKYEVAGWLEEMARVVRSFKSSQGTHLNLQKADEKVVGYLAARTSHFRVLLTQFGAMVAFKVIITVSMLTVGTLLLVQQQLNIGQFIAAEIVILTIIASSEKIIANLDSVYDVLTSLKKLSEIVNAPEEAEGDYQPGKSPTPLKLEIRNLSFGYNDQLPVINNLSFLAEPGEKVCIVGEQGSGKSTIVKLIAGGYSGYSGTILINEVPLTSYRLQSLRTQTGILTSQSDIFQGTLWENITVGRTEITVAAVMQLAEAVGLAEFIVGQKQGLHTLLGPNENRIPGSISRKIALLRALVNEPRLLLLEEPWAGFSEKDTTGIQQLLLHQFAKTTMVIITGDTAFANQCSKKVYLHHKIN
jgi:ATP-binding cassette, subfamily B, bacterial